MSSMEGNSFWPWRNSNNKSLLSVLFVLFLGQLVSIFVTMASFCSSYLADVGVDAPLTQSFFTYLSLTLVFGGIMLFRRKRLLLPWYYYLLIGFADVQGNYLVNKAYQYSSITSVTLLDCWTIPWVIILTWIFLGTRYSIWQFLGAAICVLGLGLVFLSDAVDGSSGGSKPLLGDILVVVGTIFYGTSNVSEEFCVKEKDLVELMAMLGVFGLLVSVIEIMILERQSLESIELSTEIVLGFAGYALSTFLFYVGIPFVLKFSGAALFNLSLLTSDMWSVLIRIFFYEQQVDWLYYLSFSSVLIGLLIYSTTAKDPVPVGTAEDANLNGHYQVLDEGSEAARDEVIVS